MRSVASPSWHPADRSRTATGCERLFTDTAINPHPNCPGHG